MNNVTWDGKCCGKDSAASNLAPGLNALGVLAVLAAIQFADIF